MLATQVRQKDGVFYFVSYPAEDLLCKVRFLSRFYGEGGRIDADEADEGDEIAAFIAGIERTDKAFQRALSRAKVAAIRNFYETAQSQPPIPATVLLFTADTLQFEPYGKFENVGDLREPPGGFLIIDGQHRLAALKFYMAEKPQEASNIHVPCVIFDGRSEDFAAEMFVIINSTATKINKSHLVDLYERITWASEDRKFAARVVEMLYSEQDSPLRYKINRLGGRSKQEKWILQAELFNEVHRWVKADWAAIEAVDPGKKGSERMYGAIRDFLKAASRVFGDSWGSDNYMVTRPVSIKAMIRVCADLCREDEDPASGRVRRWEERISPWSEMARQFRSDGFYERFAAKGQVERVSKIQRELGDAAGIEQAKRRRKGSKADGEGKEE